MNMRKDTALKGTPASYSALETFTFPNVLPLEYRPKLPLPTTPPQPPP
jgi:hypothetical protein